MKTLKNNNRFVWRFSLTWAAVTAPVMMLADKSDQLWVTLLLLVVGATILVVHEVSQMPVCINLVDNKDLAIIAYPRRFAGWENSRGFIMKMAAAAGIVAATGATGGLVAQITGTSQLPSGPQITQSSSPQNSVILVAELSLPTGVWQTFHVVPSGQVPEPQA
ncbi:MAG TPA: hypothetical protein VMP11_18580 [Verrucomicrobiae bacterium]|nr:hypothetical protein [Verrucomicrobiae bacterium]